MSIWYEIKKQEDVELSEDGKTIEVLYNQDYNGNNYVEIPVEFVKCVLKGVIKCATPSCDNDISQDFYCDDCNRRGES